MLDVPRELVTHLADLLRIERRRLGTRRNTRALTCRRQALLGLVWFRKHEEMTTLAAAFGLSRATAYRYRSEVITVLAAQAPDLHDALAQVAEQGWSHVIIDGKLFRTDRITQTTTSEKGATIDAWYSGKHREFGGNVQAVMRPDGHPIWTSPVSPGRHHDMTAPAPTCSARCTGQPPNSGYPPSPTAATPAPASASTPRSSSPPTAPPSPPITRPT